MHLSRRRNLVTSIPTPPRSETPHRTRTSSVRSTGLGNPENHRFKRIRPRNFSLSTSSTEERRVVAPPSVTAESMTESNMAPPRTISVISRCADGGTDTNSLPSLATSPKIARNKTFVFMYDETEKQSKAVKPSDELNISLPVLVQYELTSDETNTDKLNHEDLSAKDVGKTSEDTTDTLYVSPTIELLQKWDKNEKRNKGLHVMNWLVQVQN